MENKEIYKEMAKVNDALVRCIQTGNKEWEVKWNDRLNELLDELPHGSGIDGKWEIEGLNDTITLYNTFDAMDENGMYDQVINFKVKVRGSLMFGIDLKITGNFGKYQDIKEYLYEVLS